MAKALLALALCLFASYSVFAAAPKKKPPTWAELSPEQQKVLSPLSEEWNKLDAPRRRKWLGIAKRYPSMKPEEQAKVQKQMQPWAKLTPDERRTARERFKRIEKLPPRERQALAQKWQQYKQLPEDERSKLGSTAKKSAAPSAAAKAGNAGASKRAPGPARVPAVVPPPAAVN